MNDIEEERPQISMGVRDTLGAGSEAVSPGLCSTRMQGKGTKRTQRSREQAAGRLSLLAAADDVDRDSRFPRSLR